MVHKTSSSSLFVAGLLLSASAFAADTQGTVSQVVTLPVVGGKHTVRIYFSSYESDRWSCLKNFGYVEMNDAGPYLDGKGLDRALALATTALASGLTLGVDSPSTNPCTDANMVWLIKK